MQLSILIPYIRRHEAFFNKLSIELYSQILPYSGEIEILKDNHEYDSIGTKRNRLLLAATGKYVCFFDSDDWPSQDYIKLLMEAIESGCDCASLKGIITTDGKNPFVFEHSIKYKEWRTNGNYALDMQIKEVKYERYPNHLNMIKTSIAKQFKFPEINHAEDYDWSTQIHESGLLKTEFYIPEVIYHYLYISKK